MNKHLHYFYGCLIGALLLLAGRPVGAQDLASLSRLPATTHDGSVANTPDQEEKNVSLKSVLSELETEHAVHFNYDVELIERKQVSTEALQNARKNKALEEVIKSFLEPLHLKYKKLQEGYYMIYQEEVVRPVQKNEPRASLSRHSAVSRLQSMGEAYIPSIRHMAQTISGTVTDEESGEPLPGVNILAQGTSQGTVTGVDGNYRLTVDDEVTTLVFSSIGYVSQEIAINDQSIINVSMSPDVQSLSEVVVVGYGTQQKRDLTGSVSKVEGESLENVPSARVDQILQGRAPGVQVTQTSGEPGAATSIRIRGGNSIQGNNEPLWVIDGVIVGQNFDLNNINTNDIQSIDILKDATAVSIYGTRGANGVILVTTKNGQGIKAGKPQVSFNLYSGVQNMIETVDFLNGPQHAEYSNEDAEFRSAALPFPDLSTVPDVNWIDQVTRSAPIHNVDVSVSGASQNQDINYYISGNYFKQEGIIRNSGINKYIFRANLDYDLSDKVRTGFRLNVSRLRRENNKTGIAQIFRDHLPARAIFDDEGRYTAENPVSASIQTNPEADIVLRDDHSYVTNLLGNLYLEVEPVSDLVFRTTFSPEVNDFKRNRFNPGALPQNFVINDGGDARIDTRSSVGYINENTISYRKSLGSAHELNLLGGFTLQKYQVEENTSQAFQLSNDITGYNNLAFGSNPTRNIVSSDYDAFQLISWLGRVNYIFQSKYLFTFVGRVDGSSRFAPGNKYGFFPSGAVAWRLSEEPFIQDLGVFDQLKLRASYGISGSQAIESFRTLALLDNANTTFNGLEQAGVTLGRPANDELRWETTNQFDIGLEASFLEGRLSFELDYYNKRTEDLLLNVQIPRQTGFVSRLQNLGEMRNSGLEFILNTVNVSQNDWRWSSMLTLSGNRNEVVDLGGVDLIDVVDPSATGQGGPGGRLIVGETAPVFVGVNYLGTWKSQEEIDASGQVGQDVGGPRFGDTDGDQQITEDDFIVLGSPQPDFIYGFQNTVSYGNWSLDFFFQGTYGNEVFNSLTQTAFFGRAERTKYAETLDRWTPENPDSDIPRAGAVAALSEIKNNSEMIEDGTHMRLKNLKLTYNLPVERWGLNGFKSISVYFTGTNLFVLSDFRLNDPETSMFGRDNVALGFSQGEYPSARILSLGIKAIL
ncbi:TonB-linked SusC/RagA family outer membrane protein [Catalinimonas alkaloidigena]|uniref:SusC/RagA family TonB-linked outer membrane protein n=1 Tax=Catalinimonas alkaloidigena TaxID=1075417 RepID=UPI002405F71E|nr:TonB-dependent receptor [Catalinimonas alkaloidigena]MDF9798980.1 TonB-linked SusC/RagA family outer membrane protein [Catalinimonas alkaloidigena]